MGPLAMNFGVAFRARGHADVGRVAGRGLSGNGCQKQE
jgi:hypothetical protein